MFDKKNIHKIINSDVDYLAKLTAEISDLTEFRIKVLNLLDGEMKLYSPSILELDKLSFAKFTLLNLSFSLIEFNTYTAFRESFNSKYENLSKDFIDIPRLNLSNEFNQLIELLNQ
jgi:hypothetical protein